MNRYLLLIALAPFFLSPAVLAADRSIALIERDRMFLAATTEAFVTTHNIIQGKCWLDERATRTDVESTLRQGGIQPFHEFALSSFIEPDKGLRPRLVINAFGHLTDNDTCVVTVEVNAEYVVSYTPPMDQSQKAASIFEVWRDSSVLSGPREEVGEIITIVANDLVQEFVRNVQKMKDRIKDKEVHTASP